MTRLGSNFVETFKAGEFSWLEVSKNPRFHTLKDAAPSW
jgi:hypothetical protein